MPYSSISNSIVSRKNLRADIRQQRNLLTAEFQKDAAQQLVSQLKNHPLVNSAENIAVYLANDSELDPQFLIQWCWQHNINTYLPVIHPFSKGQLLFLHYHQASKMQLNRYGILEPRLNVTDVLPTAQLDIIFTPLVAFTNTGERLGMGGGYYDRTLATWFAQKSRKNNAKPYPIGLAHDCQQVAQIPTEDWDIPLPEIITPTQHLLFNQ